jgi:L-2-hydroxyglutarate oxidase LhgO
MDNGADALIIGAGVVGLACARALAQRGLAVVVAERHPRAGQETSSRNSGVIHSGIYYPTGSLKATLCVAGRQRLYAYCEARGIEHRRCGKLIVAQASQVDQLRSLHAKAIANGVDDLAFLSSAEAAQLEPAVRCTAALLSPSTGIIDAHEYMLALLADIEAAQGVVAFNTELVRARVRGDGFVARLRSLDEESDFACRYLVNCAGLQAIDLLERVDGYPAHRMRRAYFAKGNYFTCRGVKPFRHLVYPMPTEASLGLHATLDLDGTTRFGPDVEWVDELDYRVDAARGASFYASIRQYWPDLPDGALQPSYAGIRPKLVGAGQVAADFVIEGPEENGIPGLVNLLGIESPGLTSSLAIGDEVARRLSS